MRAYLALGLLALSACNGTADSSPDPQAVPPAPTASTDREITTLATRAFEGHWWVVTEKKCGDQLLPTANPELWRFDPNFTARQTIQEDSEERICRLIEAFDRVSTTTKAGGSPESELTYFETAGLLARSHKSVCQKKINGTPIEPPSAPVINPAPEQTLEMRVEMQGKNLRLEIEGSPDCLGRLELLLVPRS